MKTFYKILTFSLITLICTACGGGGSNSSTPSTRTLNLHIEHASSLSAISNATVTLYDSTGTQVNSSNIYVTNATGDVSVVIIGSDTNYNVKVQASTYVDQVKVIALATSTATLNETISLLSVGTTLSSAVVGLNIDPSGSAASVDTTGATFYLANGTTSVATVKSIDFTPLNPIANPSAFPGTPDITMPNGTAGLMVSSGMIDIVFKDIAGKVLTLDSSTPVKIRMPLYSDLDPNTGANLVPGNSVRFWSMNPSTGTWANEADALVVSCTGSPTGLCAEGNVTHFSWWNTDFAVAASRKESIVIDSTTNQPFDETEIESIKLLANFTEAVPGAGYYGTTAIRSSYIDVDDFVNVGNNFDAKFIVDILFTDGTRATKPFNYTWAQIDALSEFRFVLSKTDQFVDIDISTYEDSYSLYRTHPIYIRRTFMGIEESNVDMKVNGILNGDATVGTTSCGYDPHDDWHYCTYTKGTLSGNITIAAESQLDSTISDSITIDVKSSTPSLALKGTYKYSATSSAGNTTLNSYYYYQDRFIYLSKSTLQNATSVSDYEYVYAPSTYKLVLNLAEDIPLTDYTLNVTCQSSTGTACATNEEFITPFSFDVAKFPAVVNATNVYTLEAVKNTDASIRTELKIHYY